LLVRNQRPQQFRVRAAFLLSKKWALLRSFVREHPENQCGIEQTLAYRKKVGEEFERLAAISERTPLFKKTERIYSDAFELAGFAGNRLVQHVANKALRPTPVLRCATAPLVHSESIIRFAVERAFAKLPASVSK
jgi:hypothetical protein